MLAGIPLLYAIYSGRMAGRAAAFAAQGGKDMPIQDIRQRFQNVSVNVSERFPLRVCVLDGSSLEAPPTFPRPTKPIQESRSGFA